MELAASLPEDLIILASNIVEVAHVAVLHLPVDQVQRNVDRLDLRKDDAFLLADDLQRLLYLFSACRVKCNEDETLYIFMHINRINEIERLE